MLSLPGALRYCGWMGLVLTAFIALLCNLTANYLVGCMFARPGALLRTYEDIGELAMGKWGRRLVGFFQTITLFGVCTIFLILIGGNMTTLVPKLTLHAWSDEQEFSGIGTVLLRAAKSDSRLTLRCTMLRCACVNFFWSDAGCSSSPAC